MPKPVVIERAQTEPTADNDSQKQQSLQTPFGSHRIYHHDENNDAANKRTAKLQPGFEWINRQRNGEQTGDAEEQDEIHLAWTCGQRGFGRQLRGKVNRQRKNAHDQGNRSRQRGRVKLCGTSVKNDSEEKQRRVGQRMAAPATGYSLLDGLRWWREIRPFCRNVPYGNRICGFFRFALLT